MAKLDEPLLVESAYALNGRQVGIPAAAAAIGTSVPLHVATNDPDYWDVLTIECSNNTATPRVLGIQWGGGTTGTADDTVSVPVPAQTTVVAIDQRRIRGGLIVTGWNGAAIVGLTCYVQVDRYKEVRQT